MKSPQFHMQFFIFASLALLRSQSNRRFWLGFFCCV